MLPALRRPDESESPAEAFEHEAPQPKRETRLQRAFQSFMGLVLSPSDTATDRNRKKLMFPTAVFVFINQFGWSIFMLSSPLFFSMVITQLRTLQLAVFIAYMIWTKKLPQRVLEVLIITFAVSLCFLNDIATNGTREMWTCVIIVMDGLLLTECSDAAVKCMVALTILFLTVKTLEEGVSIGAYGLLPDSWTEVEIDSFDRGPGWTGAVLSIRLAVFLLDFALTRRFALGMLTQQQKANARAALAQEVAAALVRFDLDTAQKLVGNEADSLHEALRGLLNNLRLYRPYLPDALFNGKSADFPTDNSSFHYDDSFQTDMSSNSYDLQCAPRQTPPGAGSVADSDVTIVFTDVQSSTSIWEEHTAAMRDAMALHNSTIRDCVVRNNGYEVKTIGDAFMVSFDTALEGFDFSLCVQERFVSAPWPEDLLLHPLCQATQDADSRVYWRGLRVRIGLHTGPARLEFNPTTSRADYMGPTVNKAARVESASVGGAIAFTKEVFSAVELHMANVLRSPIVIDMGAIELKGVGAVRLQCCVPSSLSGRVGDVEHVLLARKLERDRRTGSGMLLQQKDSRSNCLQGWPTQEFTALEKIPKVVGRLIRNKMSLATASFVHVHVNFDRLASVPYAVDAVSELINFTLDGLERTEGLMLAVCSNSMHVCWNAGKVCLMHVAQSAKFVSHMYECTKATVWSEYITTGIATGRVLHGPIGNAKLRFVTAMGVPIEQSRSLSYGASILSTYCLLTGTSSAASDLSMSVHTRPVDKWEVSRDNFAVIFELNLRTYTQVQGVWAIFDGSIAKNWSARYKDAFYRGELAVVEEYAEDDPTLAKVLQLMRGECELPRPFRGGLVPPEKPAPEWLRESLVKPHRWLPQGAH